MNFWIRLDFSETVDKPLTNVAPLYLYLLLGLLEKYFTTYKHGYFLMYYIFKFSIIFYRVLHLDFGVEFSASNCKHNVHPNHEAKINSHISSTYYKPCALNGSGTYTYACGRVRQKSIEIECWYSKVRVHNIRWEKKFLFNVSRHRPEYELIRVTK